MRVAVINDNVTATDSRFVLIETDSITIANNQTDT